MKQASFDEIGAVLRSQQTFAVLSHVRPDGDALGSQLGLGLSLWAMAAGVLLLFAILAGAIIIAWLFTAAEYGP